MYDITPKEARVLNKNFLEDVLRIDQITDKMVVKIELTKLYLHHYGITSVDSPLVLGTIHPNESISKMESIGGTLDTYLSNRVNKYLGISYIDFMGLPLHLVDDIVKKLSSINKKIDEIDLDDLEDI